MAVQNRSLEGKVCNMEITPGFTHLSLSTDFGIKKIPFPMQLDSSLLAKRVSYSKAAVPNGTKHLLDVYIGEKFAFGEGSCCYAVVVPDSYEKA
jgi:hypothetical protein